MRKKALIIGGSGSLGQDLMNNLSKKYLVVGTYFKKGLDNLIELDITNKIKTKEIVGKEDPQIVLITAAKTNVQECELDPEDSFNINVKGIENIVESCNGRKIIFYSTDNVFDGTKDIYSETDKTNPLNIYGNHKLQAESIVKDIEGSLIIRSSRHYGISRRFEKYLNKVIDSLGRGEKIKAPLNTEGNFTFVPDVSAATSNLIERNKSGIYNVAGRTADSLYDAAIKVADVFGFDKSLIHPVDENYFNSKVKRPSSPLSIDKLYREGIKMRNLEEGLMEIKKYLSENGK